MAMMNKQSRSERIIAIVGLLLLSTGASLFARVPPEVKCADAKTKAAALAVYAQAQCQAKAVLDGTGVDPKCLQKAESKLRASFAKADAKGTCPGDADAALSARQRVRGDVQRRHLRRRALRRGQAEGGGREGP